MTKVADAKVDRMALRSKMSEDDLSLDVVLVEGGLPTIPSCRLQLVGAQARTTAGHAAVAAIKEILNLILMACSFLVNVVGT
jgi:hypothetical protein